MIKNNLCYLNREYRCDGELHLQQQECKYYQSSLTHEKCIWKYSLTNTCQDSTARADALQNLILTPNK